MVKCPRMIFLTCRFFASRSCLRLPEFTCRSFVKRERLALDMIQWPAEPKLRGSEDWCPWPTIA